MYQRVPPELEQALGAIESGYLDAIISEHRRDHFEALRRLVSMDTSVKRNHRRRAIYALGRWGDASAVADVVDVLPELAESERMTAIDALGRLGTEQARVAVASYARDPSPQVRKFVVQALARLGGPEGASWLRAIAEHDREEWIRQLAAEQLRKAEGVGD